MRAERAAKPEMTERIESIDEAKRNIVDEFAFLDDWVQRYEYIVDLGKRLDGLADAEKVEQRLVPGCQSRVWFYADRDGPTLRFRADSDALIVRGLIAILLRIYSGHTPREILATPPAFFEALELGSHLSGNRANGLHAMVKRIHEFAAAGLGA